MDLKQLIYLLQNELEWHETVANRTREVINSLARIREAKQFLGLSRQTTTTTSEIMALVEAVASTYDVRLTVQSDAYIANVEKLDALINRVKGVN